MRSPVPSFAQSEAILPPSSAACGTSSSGIEREIDFTVSPSFTENVSARVSALNETLFTLSADLSASIAPFHWVEMFEFTLLRLTFILKTPY